MKGKGFWNRNDYSLVNQQTIIFADEMEIAIHEKGEFDVDTDHNLIILKYEVKEIKMKQDSRCNSQGKSGFKS